MSLRASIIALLLIFSHCIVKCQDSDASPPIPIVQPCNSADSLLDPITHKFRSNCNPRQWCKATASWSQDPLLALPTVTPSTPQKRDEVATVALPTTQSLLTVSSPLTTTAPPSDESPTSSNFGLCVDKGCRRDEFPFGYRGVPFDSLATQCGTDQYGPDDESSCQPLLALGQSCQLNRDDSCAGDYDTPYRVLCLQGQCRLASAGANDICILDSTLYLGYNESGSSIISTISRDDCQLGLYCQDSSSRCQPEKLNGLPCLEDRECISFNCNKLTSLCLEAPIHLHRLPLWAWILITLIILLAVTALILGFYRLHLRQRASQSEEIDQFFSQQWQYRQSILSMHAAAAMATTTSTQSSSHSTIYARSASGTLRQKTDDPQKDSAWSSGLQFNTTSPASKMDSPPAATNLSPRLCRRRNPSL